MQTFGPIEVPTSGSLVVDTNVKGAKVKLTFASPPPSETPSDVEIFDVKVKACVTQGSTSLWQSYNMSVM